MHIYCLTWNICWGCMSANETSKFDVTAKALAEYCVKTQSCLSNVTKVLQHPYDIIALQEVVHPDIIQHFPYHCINTSIQNSKGAFVTITTFYKKYTPIQVYFGIVTDLNDVRPYQIILFEYNRLRFYFINIHNAHGVSREQLERVLHSNKLCFTPTQDVNMVLPYSPDMEPLLQNICPPFDVNGMHFFHKKKPVHPIIMAGDFNDNNEEDKNYWKGLYVNSVQIQSPDPPPTCCTPTKRALELRRDDYNNDTKSGDYILSNGTFTVNNRVPIHFNYDAMTFPTSDHLPVEAVITFKKGGTCKRQRKVLKKSKHI